MGFISNKVELKKQLKRMGVEVKGNYMRKKDIETVIHKVTSENALHTAKFKFEELLW